MSANGRYVYAIIATDEDKQFGPIGIGGRNDAVFTQCYQDVGAVVSSSPVIQYPVSRANTLAHQRILERVMVEHSLLPVRFGTIADDVDQIRDKVLIARYAEIRDRLTYVSDKTELGLKVLWTDMSGLFQEIVNENKEIRRIRDRLAEKKGAAQRDQVRLGEMVKKALDHKRKKMEKNILSLLLPLSVDHRKNPVFGDQMITNSAFLIFRHQEAEFDRAVNDVAEAHMTQLKFKYVGPVPPCNFVEMSIVW
ncbi:MAG: GvpL/GvpF family gas vesicle protein [Deltaproteobacteria bacterium]|nr:GvpL/GvpF family gas vesicle protein [Deltaproteobacteria bacterium]